MSKQSQSVSHQIVQTTWHGPIPPPEVLQQFKDLLPDAPDRILTMAEEEAKNRREVMKQNAESECKRKEYELREYHRDVCRGQTVAFVYLMTTVIGAVVYAIFHCEKVGMALAGMGAAGIVSNFIWKKK